MRTSHKGVLKCDNCELRLSLSRMSQLRQLSNSLDGGNSFTHVAKNPTVSQSLEISWAWLHWITWKSQRSNASLNEHGWCFLFKLISTSKQLNIVPAEGQVSL